MRIEMHSLLYDIRRQKPEMSLKEGIFTNDLEGYSIKVDRINKKTGMMYDMLIYNHKTGTGNSEVTKADSGMMISDVKNAKMKLVLYHGHSYTDEGMKNLNLRRTFPFRRLKFDKEIVMIDLPDTDLKRTDEGAFSFGISDVEYETIDGYDSCHATYIEAEESGGYETAVDFQLPTEQACECETGQCVAGAEQGNVPKSGQFVPYIRL